MRDLLVVDDRSVAGLAIRRSPPKASASRCSIARAQFSREDLMRAFDLLTQGGVRDPQLVAAAPSPRDGAAEVDSSAEADAADRSDRADGGRSRQPGRRRASPSAGSAARAARPRRASKRRCRPRRSKRSRAPPQRPPRRRPRAAAAPAPRRAGRRQSAPQGGRRGGAQGSVPRRDPQGQEVLLRHGRRAGAEIDVEADKVVFVFGPQHSALRAQLEQKRAVARGRRDATRRPQDVGRPPPKEPRRRRQPPAGLARLHRPARQLAEAVRFRTRRRRTKADRQREIRSSR